MQYNASKQPVGSLRISHEVIATIASNAAREVDGVYALTPFSLKLKGLVAGNRNTRSVAINLVEDTAIIDIRVILKQGVRIPDAAGRVQTAVKEAVQGMTGIAVSKVNVVIAGVCTEPAAAAPDSNYP
jgi:uncharacterized alkaline shock family protein YloU